MTRGNKVSCAKRGSKPRGLLSRIKVEDAEIEARLQLLRRAINPPEIRGAHVSVRPLFNVNNESAEVYDACRAPGVPRGRPRRNHQRSGVLRFRTECVSIALRVLTAWTDQQPAGNARAERCVPLQELNTRGGMLWIRTNTRTRRLGSRELFSVCLSVCMRHSYG